jgi:translation initiation factor 2B subunit (eIF-2B alpha/beta/delta family)
METRLQNIVDDVRNDEGSGAAEIFRRVLSSVLEALQTHRDITTSDLREFSIQLHLAKRSMAPIFNLSNTILLRLDDEEGLDELTDRLESMRLEMEISPSKIAENLRNKLSGSRIMTISYSSSVINSLSSFQGMKDFEVTIPISLPLGEGRQMARVLSERGIKVELIQDSMVFSLMEEMDHVVVGADAVTPIGVVNKVGTFALMAAASYFGTSAYAVCDWIKISPVPLLDPVETQTIIGENLTMRDQIFEQTPLDLLTSIITDRGELTPADVRKEMESIPLSRTWPRFP